MKTLKNLAADIGLECHSFKMSGRTKGYRLAHPGTGHIIFELKPWWDGISCGRKVWNVTYRGYEPFTFSGGTLVSNKNIPPNFRGLRETVAGIRRLVAAEGVPLLSGFVMSHRSD